MKNQNIHISSVSLLRKNLVLLAQFFLIIFVYHTLKDLKDTIVITASDAGAEVIPFIKIWGMLPASIAASYLFAKLYNRFGREKTMYIFTTLLLSAYLIFALVLYPLRDHLYLNALHDQLTTYLPTGCKGLIAMLCFWHYTLFYLAAELWSPLILAILFWGYVNETTTLAEAKKFYPICMITGNCAGIISGQASHWLCHDLRALFSWEQTLQLMIGAVAVCGVLIMGMNKLLSRENPGYSQQALKTKSKPKSFRESVLSILKSGPLMCIAILVVGFGLTSNLIEVVWKESIRTLHPDPQAYNAYINQLTSIIGVLAVCLAFASRWIFQWLSWSKVALITPTTLFITSVIFFSALMLPSENLSVVATFFTVSPILLVVSLGSIHYVLAMTAKYTLFDNCKEMAFLSVEVEERTRAKSIIDSIGSRLGKSGASCLYQFLLIVFGSASGYISVIGITSICMIGISIIATKKLGDRLSGPTTTPEPEITLARTPLRGVN
ncbi:MAG: Npt1/Npt2 family nucleotide transporter [Parachlamydiaceae bacterium]